MTELDKKIKAIASEAFYDGNACGGEIPKWLINAIYAGIRAFAEQEPSDEVVLAGRNAMATTGIVSRAHKAMMAEALKALD